MRLAYFICKPADSKYVFIDKFCFYFVFYVLLGMFSICRYITREYAIVASAIIITAVLGDFLLNLSRNNIVRAFIDSATHGLIGSFSWWLLTLHENQPSNKYEIIICGFLSSLIDIDHFIKARSWHLRDALYQDERPFLHCSTIPLLILTINSYVSKRFRISPHLTRLGWILWISFATHHIRDANRRGLWFFPIGSTSPLSKGHYISMTILLPYKTAIWMNKMKHMNYCRRNDTINREYFQMV